MSDFVKLYNPANAAALTPEQIEELKTLSPDQIRELAKAYPNKVFNRSYLLIKDRNSKLPPEKQLANLSTWENLYNLITKNGLKYYAVGFRGQTKQINRAVRPRASQVVDLSDTELMSLPGFKMAANANGIAETVPPTTVQVTKVKKVKS